MNENVYVLFILGHTVKYMNYTTSVFSDHQETQHVKHVLTIIGAVLDLRYV